GFRLPEVLSREDEAMKRPRLSGVIPGESGRLWRHAAVDPRAKGRGLQVVGRQQKKASHSRCGKRPPFFLKPHHAKCWDCRHVVHAEGGGSWRRLGDKVPPLRRPYPNQWRSGCQPENSKMSNRS